MKCVILCGGKGTRMGEYSEEIPKPLMKIGNKPILERIMDHYSKFGINDFVLCLGYLGNKIKEYFSKNKKEYNIEMVDTGEDSSKSERLLKIQDKVGKKFLVSYGDDLCNVDISELIKFHNNHKKIATFTVIKLPNPYGVIELNEFKPEIVEKFSEKPIMDDWINGGYFVFDKKIFDYIKEGEELEIEVLGKLVKEKNLIAYRHDGFWKSMNTLKDYLEFNKMYDEGEFENIFKS